MVTIPDLTAIPNLREDLQRDLKDVGDEEQDEAKPKAKAGGGGKPKGYRSKPSWTAFREKSEPDTKR